MFRLSLIRNHLKNSVNLILKTSRANVPEKCLKNQDIKNGKLNKSIACIGLAAATCRYATTIVSSNNPSIEKLNLNNIPIEKLDEWNQLIYLVKLAGKINEYKEYIQNIKKQEERELENVLVENKELEEKANKCYKKEERKLKKRFQEQFEDLKQKEVEEANKKLERELSEIEKEYHTNLENKLETQRFESIDYLKSKFNDLHTEINSIYNELDKSIKLKHKDIKIREILLQENLLMCNLRWKCQKLEQELIEQENKSDKSCSVKPLLDCLSLFKDDKLIQTILPTIPEQVQTEIAIKERFPLVENVAHRLALLDDGPSYSGFMYLISYIRSMLIRRPNYENIEATEHNLHDMDNTDILYKARACIENGDLFLAIKHLLQLKGASARVVDDWLTEAKNTLDLRLKLQVLKAYTHLNIQRSVFINYNYQQ